MLSISCVFMRSRLFIATLWSPAGKELTSCLLFVMFNCGFVTFPCGFLGRVCYLIVSIPDLCRLFYFEITHACCEVYVYTYIACRCVFQSKKGGKNQE